MFPKDPKPNLRWTFCHTCVLTTKTQLFWKDIYMPFLEREIRIEARCSSGPVLIKGCRESESSRIIPFKIFQNLSAVFHSGKFLPSKLRMEVLVRRAAKGLPSQRVLINFISPSAKLYGKISCQSPAALGCFELWNMLNMFEGSEHVKLLKHARNRPDYMVRHAEMRLRLRGLDRQ